MSLPPYPYPLEQIQCSSPVFDVCFHPHKQLLAAALVSGEVEVHEVPTAEEVQAHLDARHMHRMRQRQQEHERRQRERAERRQARVQRRRDIGAQKPRDGAAEAEADGAGKGTNAALSGEPTADEAEEMTGGNVLPPASESDADASSSEEDESDEEDIKRKHFADDLQTVETKVMTLKKHKKGCRAVRFSADGTRLYSGSTDGRCVVSDAEKGTTTWRSQRQREALNALCLLTRNVFATGDDSGAVTLWDERQAAPTRVLKDHDHYVSDLAAAWISPAPVSGANAATPPARRKKMHGGGEAAQAEAQGSASHMPTHLLATGGDMLAVFDLRKKSLLARSDPLEEDLHCVQVMKDGSKVVCGCQDGTVSIFSWGDFGDLNDRLTGHPQSVDSMVKLDETHLISGCADGLVRLVSLLPNQVLGVLGEHTTGHTAVERLALSGDKTLLASSSYDSTVSIFQVSRRKQIVEERDRSASLRPTKKTKQKKVVDLRKDSDFFDDL
ncbi:WD domain, G-beta repeat-containing protein [Besnoitia besnoiti]|uniref:WD domain, G-beta repeat-containing protein n=1 Tax=Besnoitia besnoiti TaxID=94643 RepID=A0A2A9MH15_BESBE|nr:WD domain, G-beta repeat-containing protein [Besnoitia besnoiti]PFH36454.1 WD domain, G-beta repeat-containing protein [Besnoitia besnoiti]